MSTLTQTTDETVSFHDRFFQDDIALTQRNRHAPPREEAESASPPSIAPAETSETQSSNRYAS